MRLEGTEAERIQPSKMQIVHKVLVAMDDASFFHLGRDALAGGDPPLFPRPLASKRVRNSNVLSSRTTFVITGLADVMSASTSRRA